MEPFWGPCVFALFPINFRCWKHGAFFAGSCVAPAFGRGGVFDFYDTAKTDADAAAHLFFHAEFGVQTGFLGHLSDSFQHGSRPAGRNMAFWVFFEILFQQNGDAAFRAKTAVIG